MYIPGILVLCLAVFRVGTISIAKCKCPTKHYEPKEKDGKVQCYLDPSARVKLPGVFPCRKDTRRQFFKKTFHGGFQRLFTPEQKLRRFKIQSSGPPPVADCKCPPGFIPMVDNGKIDCFGFRKNAPSRRYCMTNN